MVGSLNCKACGAYVAPNTRACTSCGRKRLNVKRILALAVAAEFAMLGAGIYWWTRPPSGPPPMQTIALDDAVITDVSKARGWSFYSTHDGAVYDLTRHARLEAAPGGARGALELRDSARYGKSVLIAFPTVASACRTNRCAMTAVFDQGEAQPYDITINPDTGTTTVEVPEFDAFVQRLTQARELTVTIVLGTATDLVLKFNVAGFAWA